MIIDDFLDTFSVLLSLCLCLILYIDLYYLVYVSGGCFTRRDSIYRSRLSQITKPARLSVLLPPIGGKICTAYELCILGKWSPLIARFTQ